MTLTLMRNFRNPRPRTDAQAEAQPPRTRIPGLHGNVRVESEFGLVPIALLRRGDVLRTLDRRAVKIAGVDVVRFDRTMMETRPELRPIRIEAGALGPGLPRETVLVAPDQPISKDPSVPGAGTLPASEYLGRPGVSRAPATEAAYYTLRLATPGAFHAEGLSFVG